MRQIVFGRIKSNSIKRGDFSWALALKPKQDISPNNTKVLAIINMLRLIIWIKITGDGFKQVHAHSLPMAYRAVGGTEYMHTAYGSYPLCIS